ncbi:MAG: hypothetical protein HPY50_16850 [Firmicutes bacterium]|nr:hypothetical protein [Bacillota bacterium]
MEEFIRKIGLMRRTIQSSQVPSAFKKVAIYNDNALLIKDSGIDPYRTPRGTDTFSQWQGDLSCVAKPERGEEDPEWEENLNEAEAEYLKLSDQRVLLEDIEAALKEGYTTRIKLELEPYGITLDDQLFQTMLDMKTADAIVCLKGCYNLETKASLAEIEKVRRTWGINKTLGRELFEYMAGGTNIVTLGDWTIENQEFIADLKESGSRLKLSMDTINEFALYFTYVIWGPLEPFNGDMEFSDDRPLIEIIRIADPGPFGQPVDIRLNYTSTRISADRSREITDLILLLQERLGKSVSDRNPPRKEHIHAELARYMLCLKKFRKLTYNGICGEITRLYVPHESPITGESQAKHQINLYKKKIESGLYPRLMKDESQDLRAKILQSIRGTRI